MAFKKLTTVADETIYQITTNSLQIIKVSIKFIPCNEEQPDDMFYAFVWDKKKLEWKLFISESKDIIKSGKKFIEKVDLILKDD